MTAWMRFEHVGQPGFGSVEGDTIQIYRGDLFAGPVPTGEQVALATVKCLPPCVPSQFLGIGYNSRAVLEKQGSPLPASPFYFLKAPGALLAHGEAQLRGARGVRGRAGHRHRQAFARSRARASPGRHLWLHLRQ
jgi:2-keto-4-pentenoate hydratase/2-oxohepta-3-ene-1,7-dioic acid hydratase in catechol pathway